ncbi:hypothetical protein G4B11_004179 [Aspergillus flavus]|nr:hypothetical protein G4B11_004179 [Aspergillus flavus]
MGVIDFIKDIIRPGNGVDYPKAGDMVTVHYHGYLYDPTRSWNRGRRFDSSIKRGIPFTFQIGMGWEVGILGMSLGEKALLTFGPHYGYGARGAPPFIPDTYDNDSNVELLAINGRTLQSDDSE